MTFNYSCKEVCGMDHPCGNTYCSNSKLYGKHASSHQSSMSEAKVIANSLKANIGHTEETQN